MVQIFFKEPEKKLVNLHKFSINNMTKKSCSSEKFYSKKKATEKDLNEVEIYFTIYKVFHFIHAYDDIKKHWHMKPWSSQVEKYIYLIYSEQRWDNLYFKRMRLMIK